MAFKSIIDIDINDAKFKEFLESFQRYKEKAEDAPEDWHKLAGAISGASNEMRGFGRHQKAALTGADRDARKLSRSLKGASSAQQGFVQNVRRGSSGLRGFSMDAAAAALGLDALATPIALVVGGIVAIGAAAAKATLSLDKLTASKFKSAKEMGMTVAQQQAFQNYGSQLFENPDATLTAIRNAKMNPADAVPLRALGISGAAISHDSTVQLAFMVAKNAHELLKGVPKDVRGSVWEARTQGKLGGLNQAELFAGRRSSMARIDHYQQKYTEHVKSYAISTAAARRAVSVTQAGGELKGKVVTDLEKVAASKLATTAAMKTIRTLRAGVNDGGDIVHKVVSAVDYAAHATIQTAKRFAATVDAAGKTFRRWVDGGKGLHAQGDALKGFMLRDEGTSRAAQAKATYEAFVKKHPNWSAKPIPKLFPLAPPPAPTSVATQAAALKGMAERYKFTSRAASTESAYKAFLKAHPQSKNWWRTIHNPMDIEAYKGDASYLNPGNGIRYAKFGSNAEDYRKAAALVRGYGRKSLYGIIQTYEGRIPTTGTMSAAEKASGFGAHQRLNLDNPMTMAKVLTGIRVTEQAHKRSDTQIYEAIYKALQQIARNTAKTQDIHVHAANGPGSRIAVATHAASR